jgi:transposase
VIDMALLSVIRRWHFREHLSIREISRRTGLSRNTVRKYLRSGEVEPQFKVPGRPSKLDPYADRLSAWLKTEANKPRKQKRTIKQLHAELMSLGYDGSYNRVAAFAREWKADRQREFQTAGRGTFVPLAFEPGEAFQFDWSEDWAIIGNERTKLQVAHSKLSYSRAFVVRAYLLQTHEMLFDAHNHGFRVLGGVPRRGIYDNMRTAVDRIGPSRERQVNARFLAMTSHYLFEPEFCNPASGWEKGQVEKNVQDARHRLWQPMPEVESLEALNAWLEQRCVALWEEIPHGTEPGSVGAVWRQEVDCLMPVRRVFDGFVDETKRVSPTCLVHFDRNRYSVPASFANRPVSLRVYPSASWWWPRAPSFASTSGSSSVRTTGRAGRSMTGAIIWPWSSESPAPCATARPSSNYPKHSGSFSASCTAGLVVTGRWWRSCPWCCSTTNRPCWWPWNWRCRRVCPPRPTS